MSDPRRHTTGHRMNAADLANIRAEWTSDTPPTMTDLATRYGYNIETISRWLKADPDSPAARVGPPRRPNCNHGHNLNQYGVQHWKAGRRGGLVKNGRACLACERLRRGHDLPSERDVETAARLAWNEAALALALKA